jgi:hypothetical protein
MIYTETRHRPSYIVRSSLGLGDEAASGEALVPRNIRSKRARSA